MSCPFSSLPEHFFDECPRCNPKGWKMKELFSLDQEKTKCEAISVPEILAYTPGVILCLHPPRFLMLLPTNPDQLLRLCSTHWGYAVQDLPISSYIAEPI